MTDRQTGRGPDDVMQRQAVRFGLRGPKDIVDCFVSWRALDSLEGGEPAVNRADRLARFERHRPTIEAAALKKCSGGAGRDGSVVLGPEDVSRPR